MRRPVQAWLLCAVLLAGGSGLATPPATPPAEAADTEPQELTGETEETAPADDAPAAEVPPPEDDSTTEQVDEEYARSGYADTTGNLENLEDLDGLRVSIRSGALRAKRGYTPLEVTLHNTEGVPRPVRLSFQGYSSGSSTTERTVELGPRQRLTTHLLLPAPVQSGLFTVSGPNLRSRQAGVYLDEGSALSALVLGSSKAFEAGTAIPRAEESKPPEVNVRFVPVQDAPRELAAYVGFPVVVVAEEVTSVPADVWAALENYAAAGGSLLVARPSRDVGQRLPLLDLEPERDAWNAYGFGHVFLCQTGVQDCGGAALSVNQDGKPPMDPVGPAPRWETNRYALSGGETPLLPNALVPLGRFLFLIFLFSLVVGPGGLILARRKGPAALLIGVPAVALVTCLIIIANSLLVDGFVTHASRYSYTWLDRPRDRAVTAAVAGYYANLPAGTVRLPSHSVLVAPAEMEEWLVDVNWAGGGMEADGFLPARTYVEWGEVAVVPSRARLVVRREGNTVRVQNALGAPLKSGYVRFGKKHYQLPELADGAEAVATEDEGAGDTGKGQAERQKLLIESVVNPPLHVERRVADVGAGFMAPLQEGTFVAKLGGVGFGPLAGLKAELHEGIHYVRGRVETP